MTNAPDSGMIVLEKVLHTLPDLGRHDGGLLAGIELVLVTDLAGISHVGQQPVQAPSAKRSATAGISPPDVPALGTPAAPGQFTDGVLQGPVLQVEFEDSANPGCFLGISRTRSQSFRNPPASLWHATGA